MTVDLPHLYRGKVRDVYDAGDDRLLLVTSDRISAFDVVMAEPIPDKGRVLTAMSAFWFDLLADVVGSHLLSTSLDDLPVEAQDPAIAGRFLLCRRAEMLKIECIVRGYLTGSAWKEYRSEGTMHGTPLPSGLLEASPLPEVVFTPSTKADDGEHDLNISFDQAVDLVGREAAEQAREVSIELYRRGAAWAVHNPADRRELVGTLQLASGEDLALAFDHASRAQRDWDARGGEARAAILERAADALERERPTLLRLLVREAGKTLPDAIAEIREAADFCRYYAAEARRLFAAPRPLAGPTGESNQLTLQGRGVLACISPWNFPLAIFTGQVAAALAAGNSVLAKPAEATPLVASVATGLLHEAGVPAEVLHFLPMLGRDFGDAALRDPRLAGVVFTGSTRTAHWLNRALAARDGAILPLVAETGGINAMLVDSTALPEQVVDDVVASAFASAGQRCSALRLLCLQEDIADRVLDLLAGAMDELVIGDPADPATDLGPVIDAGAVEALQAHLARMRARGRLRHAVPLDARHAQGYFVAPQLVALESAAELDAEHFGPLLHVLRFRAGERDDLLRALRDSGYALTLGVQTRLESTWREAFAATATGNVYVNRNMIGAVVGVQPFGGSGLSGTGPKAGGPHYLARLAIERTLTVNTAAIGGNAELLQAG